MAEDWDKVFGKALIEKMTIPVVKQLSGFDGSYEKDRVAFGYLLGITKQWGIEIAGRSGPDDTVINLMELEEGQENDEDDDDDVDETGSRVRKEEQDERPGKGFNCVPKTEEMRGFISALS